MPLRTTALAGQRFKPLSQPTWSREWDLHPRETDLQSAAYLFEPSRLAEAVGFEPTRPFGRPVFKTGAINRSAKPLGYSSELIDISSVPSSSVTS